MPLIDYTTSYSPASGSIATGVSAFHADMTLDSVQQYGVYMHKTGGSALPLVVYCPGGTPGSISLDDVRIKGNADGSGNPQPAGTINYGLSGIANWGSGYGVLCVGYRQGDNNWNSGGTSAGTDNFGGDDTEDIAQAVAAAITLGEVDVNKLCLYGSSSGCMKMLLAMAKHHITPTCVVLKAPMLDLEDFDTTGYGAAIPGFVGGASYDDLSDADKELLRERNVFNYIEDLPTTCPYLIIWGDGDTTIPRDWVDRFAKQMKARGATVDVKVISGGDHSMNSPAGIANPLALHVRDFIGVQLA